MTHLEQLPDMERFIASIYQQSVKTKNGNTLVTSYLSLQRLKDFYRLVDNLKQAKQAIAIFTHVRESFKSMKLRKMTTLDTDDEIIEGVKG